MAIAKEKKEEILKDIEERSKNASSLVFVNFHGLDVASANDLRKRLRESGVGYLVAKKTLIKKAFELFKFKGDMPELDGEIALAYSSKDAVLPAKGVADFAKGHKDVVSILGGVLDGEYMDREKTIALAAIPSREILYGKFVVCLNSPVQGLVGTMQGTIRNFVSVLSQIK